MATCEDCTYCPPKPEVGKHQFCLHQWLLLAARTAWNSDGGAGDTCWRFEQRPAHAEGQCCEKCFFWGEQVAGVCGEQDISCCASDGQECGMYRDGAAAESDRVKV